MTEVEKIHLFELFLKLVEGQITTQEKNELDTLLTSTPEAAKHYVEFINSYTYMQKKRQVSSSARNAIDSIMKQSLWKSLELQENIASPCELSQDLTPQETIIEKSNGRAPLKPGTIKKIRLIAAMIPAIIILFVFAYSNLNKEYKEVATITDQLNPMWVNPEFSTTKGQRITTAGDLYNLSGGIIETLYDNGVKVIIEGPAKFKYLDNGIYLAKGRLYSLVSPNGIGFSVKTPTAEYVDMGTEFGIENNIENISEIHVLKGAVKFLSNQSDSSQTAHLVHENNALRYNAAKHYVETIPIRKNSFVRMIDSKSNAIWRGNNTIDLADIVGGGNGLGTGKIGLGVSLSDGKSSNTLADGFSNGSDQYIPVEESEYIDGVFVPVAQNGTVQVSSAGHKFSECPTTNGVYFDNIKNGGSITLMGSNQKTNMILNGQPYGTKDHPALYIHPNAGITFDLDSLRKANPFGIIEKFTANAGVAQNPANLTKKCSLFILLDGKPYCQITEFSQADGPKGINIPILQNQRYLTIISTDGGDGNDLDWLILANLVLEMVTE